MLFKGWCINATNKKNRCNDFVAGDAAFRKL